MKGLKDGDHHLTNSTKRKLSYVDVTPLQPPFKQPVERFIDKHGKAIALSSADAVKLRAFLGDHAIKQITIEPLGGGATDPVRFSVPE